MGRECIQYRSNCGLPLVVGVKRARSHFSPLPTIRFVSNQPEIEELYNLAPVIKNLRQNADLLNAFFIDNEKT